jgi:hypothetical protein
MTGLSETPLGKRGVPHKGDDINIEETYRMHPIVDISITVIY